MGQFWPAANVPPIGGEVYFPAAIANGSNATVTVTFPAGYFDSPPIVTATGNAVAYVFLGAATTASVVVGLANRSGGTIGAGTARVQWSAIAA